MPVGDNVLAKMAEAGDKPFRDSAFGTNEDGTAWELGHGLLGDYRASNTGDGQWRTEGPLPPKDEGP